MTLFVYARSGLPSKFVRLDLDRAGTNGPNQKFVGPFEFSSKGFLRMSERSCHPSLNLWPVAFERNASAAETRAPGRTGATRVACGVVSCPDESTCSEAIKIPAKKCHDVENVFIPVTWPSTLTARTV